MGTGGGLRDGGWGLGGSWVQLGGMHCAGGCGWGIDWRGGARGGAEALGLKGLLPPVGT